MQTEATVFPRLTPSLVVSIHDVSTVTRAEVESMLGDLARVGVAVTSLLVIPDHHGKGRIDLDVTFTSWLAGNVAAGHEAVLHGYHHLRPPGREDDWKTRMITSHYTAGEGEFHDLSSRDAAELLEKGGKALRSCGVSYRGFIAPAWLLGSEAEKAVVAAGIDYTTRIGSVIDCRTGDSHPSRSLVYSVRSAWRRNVSLLWNPLLFRRLRSNPLLRIGLHPPDWKHPLIRRQILDLIRAATRERQVMTYGEWLDQWRQSGHEGKIR